MHCIKAPSQHHLSLESPGWCGYHAVHDRLRKWHWESPGWCGRCSLIHHTFPCLLLQILAQFLVGPAQFFIPRLRCRQVNLDAFLIHSWCRHRFLKGTHRLHDLLHGDVFPFVWCDRSLPRVSHIDGSLLCACEWDKTFKPHIIHEKKKHNW